MTVKHKTFDQRPVTMDLKSREERSMVIGLLSLVILILLIVTAYCVDTEPQVAGDFYPKDKKELSSTIDYYLSKYKFIENSGDLLALVEPHAGYKYSGIVAAYGYKQLENRKYDTVIIMGPSHHVQFDGLAVKASGKYITPLGEVPVDEELAAKLIKSNGKISSYEPAFLNEHSVEVQIPFLQKTMSNFKIVPVIFGDQTIENCRILSDAIIGSIGGKKVLLIASSDLSHYLSYEAANEMDGKVVSAFSEGDIDRLIEMLATREVEMCGYGPVIVAMYTSERLGGNSFSVLKYSNSGNTAGDYEKVVGYMSAAIYKRPLVLDNLDKARLLQIARETLVQYLKDGTVPTMEVYEQALTTKSGVFVTLKNRGKLRGCIGYIFPVDPLYKAVQEMSISAAVNDMRFPSVEADELENIQIEISVLSSLKQIKDPNEVQVGKHGLYIIKGMYSGLLLPQVAAENGWKREEFLDNVCYKAGLPPSAWKDKRSKLYIFEAEVFSE